MKRLSLTLTAKVEAFMANALCPDCGEPYNGDVEFDHDIALAEGGKDHDEVALVPRCSACHAKKTKADRKRIAKVKRMSGKTGQYARRKKRGGSMIKGRNEWPSGRKLPTNADRKRVKETMRWD